MELFSNKIQTFFQRCLLVQFVLSKTHAQYFLPELSNSVQNEVSPRSDNSPGGVVLRTAGNGMDHHMGGPTTGHGGKSVQQQQSHSNRRHSAAIISNQAENIKKQSANAFKFFLEQHMENVMKFPLEREKRRHQVEKESVSRLFCFLNILHSNRRVIYKISNWKELKSVS